MYNKFRIRDKLIDRFQNSLHHENDIRGYENSDIMKVFINSKTQVSQNLYQCLLIQH